MGVRRHAEDKPKHDHDSDACKKAKPALLDIGVGVERVDDELGAPRRDEEECYRHYPAEGLRP